MIDGISGPRTGTGPIVDTKLYTVVGINGYRRAGLTLDEAASLANRMREQMKVAGWRGHVRILYRDGSEVNDDGMLKEE
jgi:hypothetical protein